MEFSPAPLHLVLGIGGDIQQHFSVHLDKTENFETEMKKFTGQKKGEIKKMKSTLEDYNHEISEIWHRYSN